MSGPFSNLGSAVSNALGGGGPWALGNQYERITQGGSGSPEYNEGNSILSTLQLPNGLDSKTPFTWQVSKVAPRATPGVTISGPVMPGHNPNASTLTQMTMAGAMSWLRELAVEGQGKTDSDYNAVVSQLVAAGYLTPAQARYGSFTTPVANAFLQSAADVWNINKDGGPGQLVTWGDHISSMIQSRQAAGQIDANGMPVSSSGGGQGPQAPTRKDTYTNPDDLKNAVNSAAENILGRHLTDSEAASFQSMFHGVEKTYNDQRWAQDLSAFNNQSSTPNTAPAAVAPPSPTAAAQNYMDSSPAFGQERTNQLLGSYIGVLRNMTGLGAGGISRAVS